MIFLTFEGARMNQTQMFPQKAAQALQNCKRKAGIHQVWEAQILPCLSTMWENIGSELGQK